MKRKCFVVIAALLPLLPFAKPVNIECPKTLLPDSIKIEPTQEGWKFFAESPLYLHGAAPMSTPPEKLGHLIEDAVKKSSEGEQIYTYLLDGPFPDGKWIQCVYGERHQLSLSKRLDDRTSKCRVSIRAAVKAGENTVRIECE